MNERNKVIIRKPLFPIPNEEKSNVLKFEKDRHFKNKRNDAASLYGHIDISLPYKRNEISGFTEKEQNEIIELGLGEKTDMNCFLTKHDILMKNQNKKGKETLIQDNRYGEINKTYPIMDNMYDIHYMNKGTKNLNDFVKHVNINHTAPCVGTFRTCMHCFLNVSTLYCKTCNIFLCALCNIKLHKKDSTHVINAASSGHFENSISFNDIILKEKNKWMVEMETSLPLKINQKCSIHSEEYIKYACKTCNYMLLCSDCLMLDPIHVHHEEKEEHSEEEANGGAKKEDEEEDTGSKTNNSSNQYIQNANIYNEQNDKNSINNTVVTQSIVSISSEKNHTKKEGTSNTNITNNKPTIVETKDNYKVINLKCGFKLVRNEHEIFTLIDAKNEVKNELNEILEFLKDKSLTLKNAVPALVNITKYGKTTCKNNKKSVKMAFMKTNDLLNKKKNRIQEQMKQMQDRSTQFLNGLDEQRILFKEYLEKKKGQIQKVISLSNKNPGLALNEYVDKLETFRNLFFTNILTDIEKKLEIPHPHLKSKKIHFLTDKIRNEIFTSVKNADQLSQQCKDQFDTLIKSTIQIPVYPTHFKQFLLKRMKQNEDTLAQGRKKQKYCNVLPFTELYMNFPIEQEYIIMRKDSLHQEWEQRTITIRSVYLCIHSHQQKIQDQGTSIGNLIEQKEETEISNIPTQEEKSTNVTFMKKHVLTNKVKEKNKNFFLEAIQNGNTVDNKGIAKEVSQNSQNMSDKEFEIQEGNEDREREDTEEMAEVKKDKNIENSNENKINDKGKQSGNQKNDKNVIQYLEKDLSNDIESIICLNNVQVKLFNDTEVTNITIIERRKYPLGIELTEYNGKNELTGYWLLSSTDTKVLKLLMDKITKIKEDHKLAAPIPSFHPKINMESPFLNFHQNNIDTIYKQFAGNLQTTSNGTISENNMEDNEEEKKKEK